MKKTFLLLFTLTLLLPTSFVLAVDNATNITYKPLVTIPGLISSSSESVDLSDFIPKLYNTLIILSISLAVVVFIIYAFQYMVSSAGSITSKGAAKEGMKNVIVGLLLIFSSYLILSTINPNLVKFSLSTRPAPSPEAAPLENFTKDPAGNPLTCDQINSQYGSATQPGVYLLRRLSCENNGATETLTLYTPYNGSLENCYDRAGMLNSQNMGPATCQRIGPESPQTAPDLGKAPSCPANGELAVGDKPQGAGVFLGNVYVIFQEICKKTDGTLGSVSIYKKYDTTVPLVGLDFVSVCKKDAAADPKGMAASFGIPAAEIPFVQKAFCLSI